MKRQIVSMDHGFIIFMVIGILYVFLGAVFQMANVTLGLFGSQCLFLVLLPYIFVLYKKYNMKLSFGLEETKTSVYGRVALIMLLTYPLATMLSTLFSGYLEQFIPLPSLGIPLPKTFPAYLRSLFFFAIVPGVCEEWLFRGFLYRAMDGVKINKRIFLLALLFGLFHLNPHNLIGPFLLGLVIGYIRYRSGSLYPAMFAHALNNGIAMTIAYLIRDMDGEQEEAEMLLENLNISGIQLFFVVALISLMIYGLYKLLKNFPNYSRRRTIVDGPSKKAYIVLSIAFVLVLTGFGAVSYSLRFGSLF